MSAPEAHDGRPVPPAMFPRWIATLLAPGLAVLLADLARRAGQIVRFDPVHAAAYWGSALASTFAWGLLMYAITSIASRARWIVAAMFVALYGVSFGVQGAFFSVFGTYLSLDSLLDARAIGPAILGELPLHRAGALFNAAFGVALALTLAWRGLAVRAPVPARPAVAAIMPLLSLALFGTVPASYRGIQSTTPDFVYFHGEVGLLDNRRLLANAGSARLVRVARRDPDALPRLDAKPSAPRNVLLIVEESQRADVSCVAPVDRCELATRATNAALPTRSPLLGMRAAGSSTAVAVATIWSGLEPHVRGRLWETAPLLWDYAHAAGWDTAYWTSQNLMFGNARLFVEDIPTSHFVSGTEIDPARDFLVGAPDAAIADRALAEWAELREPFFAVVHFSNPHRPRLFDPANAPFQPTDEVERSTTTEMQKNYYRNSVYLSDLAVAKLVTGVRAAPSGPRTVIVFLADHGESFYEHDQDANHSGSVFDEEIRIPAWIDAPEGTLTDDERAGLEAARDLPTFEVDVAPTILSLMGLRAERSLARFIDAMPGRDLLAREHPEISVSLSNVSWAWEYVKPNWGVMRGTRKLEARFSDEAWRCFDVADDPLELHDLGAAACPDLVDEAMARFHMLPRELGKLNQNPRWGAGY
ncbi:MAG: sulfatase-like hydrolase/transferase [Polyangiaceae bacterium]